MTKAMAPKPGNALVLAYQIILALLFCATVNAVYTAVARRALFMQFFPGATGGVYYALLTVAFGGLLAIIGLWRWQRWAVTLFVVLGLAGMALDFAAGAPLAHKLAGACTTLLVAVMAYRLRNRFAAS